MFIKVRGKNAPHAGAWRAGRFFPNGEVVTMEVVPGADPRAPMKGDKPSMEQISQAGYQALKIDGRFSFDPDETGTAARDAAVEALRAELAEAQAELATAKMRIAEVEHGAEGGKPAKAGKGAEGGKPAKE